MRHIIHIAGRQFRNESEQDYTHVLIGQRDIEKFRPDIDPKRISHVGKRVEGIEPLSDDEKVALVQFSRDEIGGKFAVKPLVWCVSEQAAEAARAEFPAPEWINLRIIPVETTIRNG